MSRGLWYALSARTRRSLTALWIALFLMSLALQSVQLSAPSTALAAPGEGVFQLDGDAVDNGTGQDWANIHAGSDSAVISTFLTDTAGRRFTVGSKDTLDFPSNGWDSQSVPDKDDILHAFAALYANGSDPVLYFGLDRYANNGDASVGFWFFQNSVTPNGNGSFSGTRTAGDLFVVSDFSGGGDIETIVVYRWNGSGLTLVETGAQCGAGGAIEDDVCATVNDGNIAAPWPYEPKFGTAGTIPADSLFEGGVLLDEIFPSGAPCFSTFMAETRASTETTAQLKNFLTGSFDTCGDVTIIKNTRPNGPQDFTFTTTLGSGADFELDDDDSGTLSDTKVFSNVDPGTYVVTEEQVAGWDLTDIECDESISDNSDIDLGDASVTITVDPTESVTCTFTNTERGSITIHKLTSPADEAGSFDFEFGGVPAGQDPGTVGLGHDETYTVDALVPGTYTATELAPTPGYSLSSIACDGDTGSDGDVETRTATFDLDPGEDLTCTFVNDRHGTIIVEKQTSPDGAVGDFTFTGDAAGTLSDGESIIVADLPPGTYTSTESDPGEGWALGSITCDDDSSSGDVETRTATFELDPGETVRCVFTNVMDGTITIIKDADPADGTDFGFTTQGTGLSAFSLDDDADGTLSDTRTFMDLDPGDGYVVSETVLAGWDLAGIECFVTGSDTTATPNGASVDMTLGDGGSITCTFFNKRPSIDIVKRAGDADDGQVHATIAGPVTYTYDVTNDGPLTLVDIFVTDDAGTPADTSDDIEVDCPETELEPGASMTCTLVIDVLVDTTNTAVARGVSVGANAVEDADVAVVVVLEFGLLITKSNDAPLETLEFPDGTTEDLPTAVEGSTVTYTLDYVLAGDPVTDGVITDVLPVGVTYVDGSATDDPQFTFVSYDAATRTLTWTAAIVADAGSVTYQATVDESAAELPQPLVNVAVIDSGETEPVDDDSEVYVPTTPAAATSEPTLPPTDAVSGPEAAGHLGSSLMIILLLLAATVIVIGLVSPVPASVRERTRH